jgi:hypothetical protein
MSSPFFSGGSKSHLAAFTRPKIIPLLAQFHRTAPLLRMENFNIQQQWKGESYKLISPPLSATSLTCMSALLTILEVLLKRIKWIQFITSFRLVYLMFFFSSTHLLYIICRICNKCICSISTGSWMSYDQWHNSYTIFLFTLVSF